MWSRKKNMIFLESCHIYNIYPPISWNCENPLLFEKNSNFSHFFVTGFFGNFGRRKVTFSKFAKKTRNFHLWSPFFEKNGFFKKWSKKLPKKTIIFLMSKKYTFFQKNVKLSVKFSIKFLDFFSNFFGYLITFSNFLINHDHFSKKLSRSQKKFNHIDYFYEIWSHNHFYEIQHHDIFWQIPTTFLKKLSRSLKKFNTMIIFFNPMIFFPRIQHHDIKS